MLFKGEWLVKYTQASQANKLLYSGHIGFSNLKTMREVISAHVGQAGVQMVMLGGSQLFLIANNCA
jgi:hypothetical protein